MAQEYGRGVGAYLIKGLQIAETAVLIQEGVLIKLLSGSLSNEAGSRDVLYVYLDPLPRIQHLLVRLGDVLGVRELNGHIACSSQDAVQAGDGPGIAALAELHPEHHQASVGISAAHGLDKFQLLRRMLVRMTARAVGTVREGLQGTVVALLPAVDILAVGVVADRSFCDAVFLRILNQGLPVEHGLCYLIHGE